MKVLKIIKIYYEENRLFLPEEEYEIEYQLKKLFNKEELTVYFYEKIIEDDNQTKIL